MQYIVTVHKDAYTDFDGKHKSVDKAAIIPFCIGQPVWYVYKRRKRYVVQEFVVAEIWYTGMFGVGFTNSWHIGSNEFDRIFRYSDLDEACELCNRLNQLTSVKVIRM